MSPNSWPGHILKTCWIHWNNWQNLKYFHNLAKKAVACWVHFECNRWKHLDHIFAEILNVIHIFSNCPYKNSKTIITNSNKKSVTDLLKGKTPLPGLPWAHSWVLPLHRLGNGQGGIPTPIPFGNGPFGAIRNICERASCYAHANLPRTVPKSYWSWPVAICEESVPTCTVVSSNTGEVHVPRRLYACRVKTEVPG